MSRLVLFVVLLVLLVAGAFLLFEDDAASVGSALKPSPSLEAATAPTEPIRRGTSSQAMTPEAHSPAVVTDTVKDGPSTPDVEALTRPRIVGRAVDAEGTPLSEVRVIIMKSTRTSPSLVRRKVVLRGRCDASGRFRFDDVPMGELIVVLDRFDPNHVVGADRALTVDAVRVYDLGDVMLGGEGHMKLSLKFLLPDGRPAAGQMVKVNAYDMNKGPRSGMTDEEGEVSFDAWAPEDGFSIYAMPPNGCTRIYARVLPESQRPNFEGLLEDEGWFPRSKEYIRFYPGDEFFATFRFQEKKVAKKKMGILAFHLPRPEYGTGYCYTASFLDDPPRGTGHSLNDGPPYEVKLPQGRLLVHVSRFEISKGAGSFTVRKIARKEILLGERYDWAVEFDDVIWARCRLVRDGKPLARVMWSQTLGRTIVPFTNSGKTDEKGESLIPLDPYSKEWSFDFALGEDRSFHYTFRRKPLITDDEGRRVFDVGDIVVGSEASHR